MLVVLWYTAARSDGEARFSAIFQEAEISSEQILFIASVLSQLVASTLVSEFTPNTAVSGTAGLPWEVNF